MTIPKGFITTGQAAIMLGFADTVYGRQYLSMTFRYSDNAPARHGRPNANMHYKKTDVARWLKNNDVKKALKHARQMANGKIIHKPVNNLQQLRIDFLTGKINYKPKRQRASEGLSI